MWVLAATRAQLRRRLECESQVVLATLETCHSVLCDFSLNRPMTMRGIWVELTLHLKASALHVKSYMPFCRCSPAVERLDAPVADRLNFAQAYPADPNRGA